MGSETKTFKDEWHEHLRALGDDLNIDVNHVNDEDHCEIFRIALRTYQRLEKLGMDIQDTKMSRLRRFIILSWLYLLVEAHYPISEVAISIQEMRRLAGLNTLGATAQLHGNSNIHDENGPRNIAPVPNQDPEPDEYAPCDEDSDNMYDKYDNNNPYEPCVARRHGDSDSDLLDEPIEEGDDDDLSYQIDATYRRKRSYKKHEEYSAKGKAIVSWLEQEIDKGEKLSVQELEGEWHLYSEDYIKFQQKTCKNPQDVSFKRGKLSITHHDAGNGTGYDGFVGHITLPEMSEGCVWKVSGYTPSSAIPTWRAYYAQSTKHFIPLKMTFCGNGYMTMTCPVEVMGEPRGEEDCVTYTGIFSEKTKVEKEMEWTKQKGKWIYCGQFDDGDDSDNRPWCYENKHGRTCDDEDCNGHVGEDRSPMTSGKKSRMPRRRPRRVTESPESDCMDFYEEYD